MTEWPPTVAGQRGGPLLEGCLPWFNMPNEMSFRRRPSMRSISTASVVIACLGDNAGLLWRSKGSSYSARVIARLSRKQLLAHLNIWHQNSVVLHCCSGVKPSLYLHYMSHLHSNSVDMEQFVFFIITNCHSWVCGLQYNLHHIAWCILCTTLLHSP